MTAPGLRARLVVRRSGAFLVDVDLAIPPGTTVALLGPNGAGKSTVVAALAGLLPIEAGRIEIGGVVLDDPEEGVFVPPERRRVGVVFQEYLLFPHLSVMENICFGPRSQGTPRGACRARAEPWIRSLGLVGLESRRPGDLSGGQAQRVALARALVIEPDLLLLDEPLAALDVTTRTRLRRTLSGHLAGFPGPRMLITHDPAEAFLLADRIHIIEEGRITQTGTADEIRLRPRTPYAADLAGSNLVMATAREGAADTGAAILWIADREIRGPVLLTIRPNAISVFRGPPEGSPRNSWETTLERLETLGSRVRLLTGPPLPLAVEVTREAARELDLHPGRRVWVSVKATEIGVQSEDRSRADTSS
jgi:molybdate transport system ATP-binding protein